MSLFGNCRSAYQLSDSEGRILPEFEHLVQHCITPGIAVLGKDSSGRGILLSGAAAEAGRFGVAPPTQEEIARDRALRAAGVQRANTALVQLAVGGLPDRQPVTERKEAMHTSRVAGPDLQTANFLGIGDVFGIIKKGVEIVKGLGGDDDDDRGRGFTPPVSVTPSCSPGFVWNGSQCVRSGARGAIERALPGGRTGTAADIYGDAVLGAWGIPALVPAQVGTITRNDGSSGPIYRCPRRMVLGEDNLCYRKGSIPNARRKHPRGTRPFLTGGDRKCLMRAARLKKSKANKRLLRQLGLGG